MFKMENAGCILLLFIFGILSDSSSFVFIFPPSPINVSVGQNVILKVTSNATLNDSYIICEYSINFNCTKDMDVLYASHIQPPMVVNGSTGRHARFNVTFRSELDFDINIQGVTKADEGCYRCMEFTETKNKDSTNLHVFVILSHTASLFNNSKDDRVSENNTDRNWTVGIVLAVVIVPPAIIVITVFVIRRYRRRRDQGQPINPEDPELLKLPNLE